MSDSDFDLLTIGAGSGGVAASRRAASYGARVALCEERRLGGTCVLRGCVPKKLLVYGVQFRDAFEDAAGFGWTVGATQLDWGRLVAAKERELDRLVGAYEHTLGEAGVTVLRGRATVVDPHTVLVGDKTYTSRTLLIATGGGAVVPAIPGAEHVITSDAALELRALPKRMVIVGGGYIGVEFAGIFNTAGVEVTQIVRGDGLLHGFDDDVRAMLREQMTARGVRIHCETQVRAIERTGHGYRLELDRDESIETDLVLYATGRAPNSRGFGLKEVGVHMNPRGAIVVDGWSQTNVRSIYAVGDVTARVTLTPVAIAEGRALAETLFHDKPTQLDYAGIPSGVFSQPPVGTVGLTECAARARGGEVDVYRARFRPMKYMLAGREERSMMKLVVDKATDRVLGCHMVGPDAPEIVQGLAIALKCGATKAQFDATVGIHPTAAEEFVTMRDPVPATPTPTHVSPRRSE